MRMMAFLLEPGTDLRQEIERIVEENDISAATILSCAGALKRARLRMAGTNRENQDIKVYEGHFEVLSLNGNVGPGRTHLHMAISDEQGNVFGGYVKGGGNIIDITMELVIAVEDKLRFTEKHDPRVGWDNLVIEELDD